MAIKIGVNFRDTSGYVTDGTDETYCLRTDGYPTTRAGVTFGWGSEQLQSRNRNTANSKLAGFNNPEYDNTAQSWYIDLDAASLHDIRAAFGDYNYSVSPIYARFFDGGTGFKTVSGDSLASTNWFDADGTLRTSVSDWVNNNTKISRTFGGSQLRVLCGDGTSSKDGKITHVSIEEIAVDPIYAQHSFRFRNDDGTLGELP